MKGRSYSAISKFKRVEASLREARNGISASLREINRALDGPRTDEERALLASARDQVMQVREGMRAVLWRFWGEVEG